MHVVILQSSVFYKEMILVVRSKPHLVFFYLESPVTCDPTQNFSCWWQNTQGMWKNCSNLKCAFKICTNTQTHTHRCLSVAWHFPMHSWEVSVTQALIRMQGTWKISCMYILIFNKYVHRNHIFLLHIRNQAELTEPMWNKMMWYNCHRNVKQVWSIQSKPRSNVDSSYTRELTANNYLSHTDTHT
jgi:hypothetical protein